LDIGHYVGYNDTAQPLPGITKVSKCGNIMLGVTITVKSHSFVHNNCQMTY